MTIKEYWNLIGREPFLAITWEPDFSQACSFCRILMNHKNFHFSQIPGKTNDVIFLKSSKTLFLGHFLPFLVIFCPMGIFSKKSDSVTNNYIWNPKTIVSFRKNCANPEKTYEQTEGRTDPILQDSCGRRRGPKKLCDEISQVRALETFKSPASLKKVNKFT